MVQLCLPEGFLNEPWTLHTLVPSWHHALNSTWTLLVGMIPWVHFSTPLPETSESSACTVQIKWAYAPASPSSVSVLVLQGISSSEKRPYCGSIPLPLALLHTHTGHGARISGSFPSSVIRYLSSAGRKRGSFLQQMDLGQDVPRDLPE